MSMSLSTDDISPAQLRCCDLRIERVLPPGHWLRADVVAQRRWDSGCRACARATCGTRCCQLPAEWPWGVDVSTPHCPPAARRESLTLGKIIVTGKHRVATHPGAADVSD